MVQRIKISAIVERDMQIKSINIQKNSMNIKCGHKIAM